VDSLHGRTPEPQGRNGIHSKSDWLVSGLRACDGEVIAEEESSDSENASEGRKVTVGKTNSKEKVTDPNERVEQEDVAQVIEDLNRIEVDDQGKEEL